VDGNALAALPPLPFFKHFLKLIAFMIFASSTRPRVSPRTITLIIIAINVMTCTATNIGDFQGEDMPTAKTIEEVLKENSKELLSVPGVVGTAQGLCDNRPCIKVYVTRKTPALKKKIPDILKGYPVMIEETGEFRTLPKNQN
jgi:hypothetical protein